MAGELFASKRLQGFFVHGRVIDEVHAVVPGARVHDRADALREGDLIERIVEEDDQVARRIIPEPRIGANHAQIVAPLRYAVRPREILFCDLMQSGRDFDADDTLERGDAGQQERASHAGAYIDEGGSAHHLVGKGRRERVKVRDRDCLVVGRVCVRVADEFRIQIVEKENCLRRYAMLAIEPAAGRTFTVAHRRGIRRRECEHREG